MKVTRQLSPVCGTISLGNSPNCTYPNVAGVNERLILFNWGEIEGYTIASLAITAITMASGKVGYAYNGKLQSVKPKTTLEPKTYSNPLKHEVQFLIFGMTPADKNQIELMKEGRLAAIVENNYKGTAGETAFELYGKECGMYVTALERDPNSDENQGAYVITLSSKAPALEPKLPASIFLTDYAATKAIVDALLVP